MLNSLYTLIIYPPVLLIEIAFELFNKIFKNTSISILGVSGAVTFLCLPLYIVAEKWQNTERKTQKQLASMLDNIKAVFKGDERFMILQEFYRQNHYHPIYALRSSFGILIQIPFFMAAYSYLSNLEALKGVSFLFINDLGAPDAVAKIGNFTVNILPILMTFINIGAGILYTKGLPLKDKFQLFGMAGIFLLLLYNSPAGLVVYWTMNNIFSLIKNIFYRLKNPLKKLYIILASIIIIFIFYMIFINKGVINKRLIVIAAALFFLLTPIWVKIVLFFYRNFSAGLTENPAKMAGLFILFSLGASILTGLCIPSSVISSSPEEFSLIDGYTTPLIYLGHSFLSALGLFSFWPICVYFLFGKKIKSLICSFFGILFFIALVNTFVFQGNYGLISNIFQFSTTGVLDSSLSYSILNGFVILAVSFVFIILLKKKLISYLLSFCLIIVISLSIFSFYNIFNTQKSFLRLEYARNKEDTVNSIEKIFHLARDKQNIVIIMADCAVNGLVKPIFESRPDLYNDFDGFKLYPNTVSFSLHTLMAVPPVWGGYEYTPFEMNNRNTIPQKDKHNESLLLLPTLLSQNGFDVTVTDPSWANYEWTSDVSIYNERKKIKAFNTIGRYSSLWFQEHSFGDIKITAALIKRNSLFFSFLKIVPPLFRFIVYDKGHYWAGESQTDSLNSFVDNYAVLDYLPKLFSFDATEPQALLLTNEITHKLNFLQYPDYEPVPEVTDKGPPPFNENQYYHSNASFYIRLSKWIRELKKQGVYDNTRIIIVSDHGANINTNISDTPLPIPGETREGYNPLLLIKDFNSKGKLSEDNSFMTNADVPMLALRGIINNPVNPFTGKLLSTDSKKDGVYISLNHQPMVADHGKYEYNIKNNQWMFVKDNIKKSDNWKLVEP